ncbi:polysaccharide pyruvyl transferase family protein [Pseudoalteromonas sp. Isolate6]|uniref:polysaccharide pyruvyl transferase family protein n=1 Tax=Pseudoalteromonas sp. Isolate6 TaxID=2908527 RepID=UPI001EFDF076|nr:polysaccharide pyruvyl transferase family protein [Pseudoalteromonas sp. Isolate6]
MKKIVLLGAFDRYNYGDNLMPILFERFIKKYRPEVLEEFQLEYAAVSKADLTNYKCLPSESINNYTTLLNDGSAVIVIGGEVLCATNATLYLHMQKSALFNKFLTLVKKATRRYFSLYSDWFYSAKWEYPFIVDPASFDASVKVIYNTVGGGIQWLRPKDKKTVVDRLNKASYVSVRDTRTQAQVQELTSETGLAPDSAFLMSDLVDDDTFAEHVSEKVRLACSEDYIVFQAAPTKVGNSIESVVENLKSIAQKNSKKIILLPIGYASGHDDNEYLVKLSAILDYQHELLYPLNVWEIMYVIKQSSLFIGTSLHGVITAMAYAKPHVGLNPQIPKLDSFLKDWSLAPFNKCLDMRNAAKILDHVDNECLEKLKENRNRINQAIIENNNKILDIIKEK